MQLHLACRHCDQLVYIASLQKTQVAYCPNCRSKIALGKNNSEQKVVALSICAIAMLLSSLFYPFISFSEQGITQTITLLDAGKILFEFNSPLLGILIDITIIFLPLTLLVFFILIHIGLLKILPRTYASKLLKMIFILIPWVMSEIFLIGILISMIKIMSIADISFGLSFFSFSAFIFFYLMCLTHIDKNKLWQHIAMVDNRPLIGTPARAIEHNYRACHNCQQLISSNICDRCHSKTYSRYPFSIQKVMALLLTSLILYIPANYYPIMHTWVLNQDEPSTILGGIVTLWQMGSYPIAIIIFIASIIIPLAKIFVLTLLCYVVTYKNTLDYASQYQYTKMYQLTEFIGKWSMLDVFVVAVLVALVQLGALMSITPGVGAIFFAAMVFTSMLAAHAFDSRLLWDSIDTTQAKSRFHNKNQEYK
ncbi:PqiA/YebS family transporter subunit [Pseudoalteromonas denitrificans]|uniref:Paraquat-inducible protein A n=1 Tax=Pseudoalteromonas denitrificans DSM 6059 TaxID=1123010 RepID=A0A1I1FLF1_9GAMM|nr:PqiA/YebS family transporter subunit [Pseudoalteromonas denitrificans]SFB99816.1 paraquat-inducible protein A [Pseudoalteromonas denitrificans DSM 6059]